MNVDRVFLSNIALEQQRLLGGKGMVYYGAINSGVDVDPRIAAIPPWERSPEGHVPFDHQGVVALPLVGAVANVLTFVVPQGFDGVVERFSLNFTAGGFIAGSGDIVWRIFQDNKGVKNYSNIQSELGTLQIARPIDNMRLFSGQTILITVTHVANAALNGDVIATMAGYYYPRKGQ